MSAYIVDIGISGMVGNNMKSDNEFIQTHIPVTLRERREPRKVRTYYRYCDLSEFDKHTKQILIQSQECQMMINLSRKMWDIFSEDIEGLVYWSTDGKLNYNMRPVRIEVSREFSDLIRYN